VADVRILPRWGSRFALIGFALAAMTAFVGCLLPSIGHAKRLNLTWGFIYGLGWHAAGLLSDPRNPWAQLFGGKIWPVIVIISIVFAARFVRHLPNRTKTAITELLFASLFVILPNHLIIGSSLDYIPTYSKILPAVY
jgi:hypothetical protein